jgi:hypothetical protein
VVALSRQEMQALIDCGSDLDRQRLYDLLRHPLYTWTPRPDDLSRMDEQTAFVESRDQFAICLGGTGSGKTYAAAVKTARYVLGTAPMREGLPFWIVSDTMDQVCAIAWDQKLKYLIPPTQIMSVVWYQKSRGWPAAVVLKHPTQKNRPGWVLEFKSYNQPFSTFKGQSIGGYWLNEEVPYSVVIEVQGRCREYNSPGWADFTPVEVVSPEWPELYDAPPPGWRFYHLNTECNWANAAGWADWFLSQIPEDLREMRRTGVFATFKGQVFKEWRPRIHVTEPFEIPKDWHKVRGVDFGFNNPFCCLWVARDPDGRYYVYDEHFQSQQLNAFHAAQIKQRRWQPALPWFGQTYSDHDAQQRAELAGLDILCTPANKAIAQGLSTVRSLMQVQEDGKPRLMVFKNCKNLIREIAKYRFPEGTTGRNPSDLPVDKDNHAIDALRYAIYSDYLRQYGGVGTTQRQAAAHGVRHGYADQRPVGLRSSKTSRIDYDQLRPQRGSV